MPRPSDQVSPPEGTRSNPDPMPPALRRRLQVCYERGLKLSKEEDHDYAHEMLSECVGRDPSNLVYVEAMLGNLQRKYNNNKKGARLKGFGGRGGFKKAAASEDWEEVLQLGMELLKVNPWDVATLRTMATACAALHYNEVELRYLKNALDANPKNVDVNRHCARSLARMGQFDQAIACWHRVEEFARGDQEAPKMISELTVEKTRHAGGLPEEFQNPPTAAASARKPDAQEGKPESKPPPIALTPRQKLEQAIQDDPANVLHYLQLAELYSTDGQYAEAENVLTRALAASGNELKVREQLETVQMRRSRARLAVAEKRLAAQPTDEAKDLVKGLRGELNRLEIEIFGARNQRYPDHSGWQYELGVRLKRAGNYNEAIKYLQQAREDPARKAAAALEIGECLQQTRQYQKALESYVFATQEVRDDEPERKKLAYYRAGVLAMGLKDENKAKELLSKLIELDPEYRDAASRLDTLRKIDDT